MKKFLLLIFFILAALLMNFGSQKLWLLSSGRPLELNAQVPKFAEHHILLGQKIDINTASISLLDTLPGIGPKTAIKIVDTRASLGGFSSIDDIKKVNGIGPVKFSKIRHFIVAN